MATVPATAAAVANRAAVLLGPGELRLEQRAVPEPREGEVLLQVLAVGVCGSGVHYYEHGRIGNRVVRGPHVLGHEACGRVIAVGPGVATQAIGERVCLEPGVPCGHCRECRAGHYNVCEEVRFYGSPPVDGALCDYVAVRQEYVHRLPPSLSDEAGALIEPLAVAVWACRVGKVGPGSDVLVTGAGPVGLLVAQVARASGASSVAVTDVNPHRIEAAARLGFSAADGSIDVLIECLGSGAAVAGAVPRVRPGGTVVLVGMGEDEVTLPLDLMQRRELWVTGVFRYAGVFPGAIQLAADGKVDLDGLVTKRFSLAESEDAIMYSRRDPTALKGVVVISS